MKRNTNCIIKMKKIQMNNNKWIYINNNKKKKLLKEKMHFSISKMKKLII